ncbi:hypothetical protein, partial [Massilia genomosp. 1]|uniref:hypothetical protein n=1 Tax=Massilia genomosp. 1 TaxID=2609280 RepID=UPI001C9E2C85
LFRGGKLGKIWKGAQFCHDQHHGPISRNEQLWHVLAQAKQLRSKNTVRWVQIRKRTRCRNDRRYRTALTDGCRSHVSTKRRSMQ